MAKKPTGRTVPKIGGSSLVSKGHSWLGSTSSSTMSYRAGTAGISSAVLSQGALKSSKGKLF